MRLRMPRRFAWTLLLALLGSVASRAAEPIDLRLVLTVDVSASMKASNIDLLFAAHAEALRNPEVKQALLRSGPASVSLRAYRSPPDF